MLIWRKNKNREYYIFPGGGVEDNETEKQAAAREMLEETSIKVKVKRLLYHHRLSERGRAASDQYFYLCGYLGGRVKLGDFNEKRRMADGKDFYKPLWINLNKLPKLLLYPLEIRDWLIKDLKNKFKNAPRHVSLKVEDLRQSL